jgi:alkylhydroperoxidase family enzyme
MTPLPIRAALRTTLNQVRYVGPVKKSASEGRVAEIYDQVERDFGMLAPPVALHSPSPAALASVWVLLRETLVAGGAATRASKEAVAAAVSLDNTCPYCVEVHGAMLDGLVPRPDAGAIAEDRIGEVDDPGLRAVAAWARETGDAATCQAPPVSGAEAAELIGVALAFQYLNRMVNVFLGESPLPPEVPGMARKFAGRQLGRMLRPTPGREPEAGRSLDFLPAAAGSPEWAWAAGNESVAAAFARVSAAVDAAGAEAVSPAVREVVRTALERWTGRPPGLSRDWVEPALDGLSAADRAAGRLALLTAISSYQVDETIVDAFREHFPADAALVELTSWASFEATRRVAAWMSTARETSRAA